MKARQIDKVIYEKVAALAEAHPPIKQVLLKNSIVTGGCIASMLLKEKVNDYDIYFDSLPALVEVMEYFGNKTGALYLVAFDENAETPEHNRIELPSGDDEENDFIVPIPVRGNGMKFAIYSSIAGLRDDRNVKYI